MHPSTILTKALIKLLQYGCIVAIDKVKPKPNEDLICLNIIEGS